MIYYNNEAINFEGQALEEFVPTTEEELRELIKENGIKTSSEDPIPTKVLNSIIDVALPCLKNLINQFFMQGSMNGVKESVIDPLLKKIGLDHDIKKHYRPVYNLLFFSKLIERVVSKRLHNHMHINNLKTD